MRTFLAVLVPCFVISVLYLYFAGTRLRPQRGITEMRRAPATTPAPSSQYPSDWIDCVSPTPEQRFWASHGSGPGVTVYGFPSKGGLYVLHNCLGVELDFLGLDRFRTTERPSKSDPNWQAKEEAHCDRMRRLGARWVETNYDLFELMVSEREDTDPYICVGWPAEGGVWVLNTTYGRAIDLGTAIIYNANNMEERCEMIKILGGIFYQDPKDCPYLDLE
ncbi:hypothetical protein AAWM_11148 [Aspergillus awamori]|uniref:Uncharacterized protein n=1 Tax=Aspergillus awamori TaxID=105351 RepID=A0A401L9N6_ASPAW|nr:hypothetical protein AAWM_11148 [Aspergillus awamori]GLA19678.1 hypothetical protein AnigIFM62618_007797 [Aspergillus niger]